MLTNLVIMRRWPAANGTEQNLRILDSNGKEPAAKNR